LATQIRQALLLGLAYNIYRLRHRFAHGGCQQSLSVDSNRLIGKLTPLDATLTKKGGGKTAVRRNILRAPFSFNFQL
jgi:hypothetical protein